MARCPFAQWMPLPWSAGHYLAGPFKIVHHTTEGASAAGAFQTYQQTHDIPHFTVDDTTIYQHVDTDTAATALAHPPGTVETNRHSAIQFELVGFAGKPKSRASLHNVGRLCRWIEHTHGVPAEWPNGFPDPPVNGQDPGHHNRNLANWTAKGGHYGHSHVPANVHWDPAYTRDETEFIMSVPGPDHLDVVAEKAELPVMAAQRTIRISTLAAEEGVELPLPRRRPGARTGARKRAARSGQTRKRPATRKSAKAGTRPRKYAARPGKRKANRRPSRRRA